MQRSFVVLQRNMDTSHAADGDTLLLIPRKVAADQVPARQDTPWQVATHRADTLPSGLFDIKAMHHCI